MIKAILILVFLFLLTNSDAYDFVTVQNSTTNPVNVKTVSGVTGSTVTVTQGGDFTVNPGTGVFPISGTVGATQSGPWTVNPGTGTYPVIAVTPSTVTFGGVTQPITGSVSVSNTPPIQIFSISGTAGSGNSIAVDEGNSSNGTQRVVLAGIPQTSTPSIVGVVIVSTRTSTLNTYVTNVSSAAVFTRNDRSDPLQEQILLATQTNNILTLLANDRVGQLQGYELR